jgi:hypothetical protein
MKWIFFVCFLLVWLKSITVGSEFNFIFWFRFRKFYTHWYFKLREPETFEDYTKKTPYTFS